MKLTDRCLHSFESRVRSRGDAYARSGHITELTSDGVVVDAEVTGSYENIYDVMIDFADCASGKVLASCECPYFDGGDLCKHIWAVLRQMDDSGVKFNGQIPTTLYVEPDYGDDEEDYEDGDWPDRRFGQEQARSPVGRRMPPRQPAWRTQLERLGLDFSPHIMLLWRTCKFSGLIARICLSGRIPSRRLNKS